ncbi:CRISPR-associated protein Cas4 [Trichothermofontia sp.]
MDEYLPLAYLNAWEYCPRRFYLQYVLGEWEENEHIVLGQHLHRNIDEMGVVQEGEVLVHRQQWVWSDRLEVKGIIDGVEEREGRLVPLEYKKGRMARHLNDHFQLCAAGLCLEERTGREIGFGEIFYYGNRRRQVVWFTPELREATEAAIAAARAAMGLPMPGPIANKRKCEACSLVGICLPFKVRVLSALTPGPSP